MRRALVCSLGFVVMTAASVVHGTGVPFGSPLPFAAQDGAAAVAVADLDRDGWMDVAMALIDGDAVKVRFGGDTPTYLTLASGFDRACDVVAADVNGDGWLDVVGAKRGTGDDDVRWWENPGDGGGGWSEHPVSGIYFDEARGIDAGDLDRDGDLDLVVAGVDGGVGYVSWYSNNGGAGTSWTLRDLVASLAGAHDAHVADVNGDGLLDVVAAAYDADKVVWFLNDGEITVPGYWTAYEVQAGFDGAICVASGDIDGDGDLDLVAGAYLAGDLYWFANDDGVGTAWVEHEVIAYLDGVYSVQPVDMDADGTLDLLATGRLSDQVTWLENEETWWRAHDVATLDGARSAVAVDFDGEGDLDVLAAAEFADQVAWWPNRTTHRTASFPAAEVVDDATEDVQTLAAADMDRDGSLDIVTGTRNESSAPDIIVWRQLPGGWSPVVVDTDFNGAVTVRLADVNRDGALDIVSYAIYSQEVSWFENVGPTTYLEHPIASVGQSGEVDVADLDCDGDLDVVAIAFYTDHLTWWENSAGDGSVWLEQSIPTSRIFDSVWAGDVDGDGDSDLVADRFGTPGSSWVLDNGTCDGGDWTASTIGAMHANDVQLGDFNLDGSTDLAVACFSEDTVAVWLWTGAWERHDVTTTHDGVENLVAADLDEDGDLDLAAAAFYPGELRWWANDGSGTSWTESLVADGLDLPPSTAAGDVDRDGDQDLVVVEWGADRISVYPNHGGQYLVESSDQAPAYLPNASSAAVVRFSVTSAGWTGDPNIELRRVSLSLMDGAGVPFTQAQAAAIFAAVQVWHDANGSGFFESQEDLMLLDVPPPMPAPGELYLELAGGGVNPPIAGAGGSATYFAVFKTTADATAHLPDDFQVRHHPGAVQETSYVDFPTIRLKGERWNPVTTRVVTLGDGTSLPFADGFESGDTSAWSATVP